MARETYPGFGPSIPATARLRDEIATRLSWLRATPFWAISALVHLLVILLLLGVIVRENGRKAAEETTVAYDVRLPVSRPAPPARPEIDRKKESGMHTRPFLSGPTRETERAGEPDVVFEPDLPPEPPRGDPKSDLLAGPTAGSQRDTPTPFGFGPRGAATRGTPDGTGQKLRGGGPGPDTERALDRALEWLRRHQSPDGSWKSRDFTLACGSASPCRNADPARHGEGRGFPEHDVGVTGLAMLAFTGDGHTHRDGAYTEYVECLRQAMGYLRRVQVHSLDPATNGRFGPADAEDWIYGHAIATLAMAELLAMSGDRLVLEEPVTNAVKLCLAARNEGFGWRYGIKPGENDTSVTGWMVLALKTASKARLKIPPEDFERAIDGALSWIHRATASNGKTGYQSPGDEGSRLNKVFSEPYPFSKEPSSMTAVGVLCRIFAGEGRESPAVRDGVKVLLRQLPRWQETKGRALSTINFYYWYYGSYALFQHGGAAWTRWNEAMNQALVDTQRQEDSDEHGSWDPIDEWGAAGGRVYSTALAAMTLEVYYRYIRIEDARNGGRPARESR